jgi:hypothetical protein
VTEKTTYAPLILLYRTAPARVLAVEAQLSPRAQLGDQVARIEEAS